MTLARTCMLHVKHSRPNITLFHWFYGVLRSCNIRKTTREGKEAARATHLIGGILPKFFQ